jgi:hypothetical protein
MFQVSNKNKIPDVIFKNGVLYGDDDHYHGPWLLSRADAESIFSKWGKHKVLILQQIFFTFSKIRGIDIKTATELLDDPSWRAPL